jgi:hypothetical protein
MDLMCNVPEKETAVIIPTAGGVKTPFSVNLCVGLKPNLLG